VTLHRWDVSNTSKQKLLRLFCPPYLFPVGRRHHAVTSPGEANIIAIKKVNPDKIAIAVKILFFLRLRIQITS